MKHEEPGQVLEAIRRVLAGEIYLSQRISARVLNRLVGVSPAALPEDRGLTGSPVIRAFMISSGVSASNGGWPVTIS